MYEMCYVNLAFVSLIGAVPGSRNHEQVAKAPDKTDHDRLASAYTGLSACSLRGPSLKAILSCTCPVVFTFDLQETLRIISFFLIVKVRMKWACSERSRSFQTYQYSVNNLLCDHYWHLCSRGCLVALLVGWVL